MKKLLKKKYKNYQLFFYDEKYQELGKKIVDKDVKIIKEIKVTDRNYVSKIKYNGGLYILKSPRNEHRKFQRKVMTLFKRGEALSTLVNTSKLIDKGLDIFATPYIAIVKRKNGMIVSSYFVTEYFEEKKKKGYKKEEIQKWLELGKKLHDKKVYHGDLNPANIIDTDKGVKLIDSQCKKYYFGEYRSNYDKLTLEYSTYGTIGKQKWYKIGAWHKLAKLIKTMRNGGEKNVKGIK
ncbi:lipopolysaccharide core heptose(II) kinase RfaY [Fusobacterium sp. MFO224]|uniref:lipopolysaccharide core heptose(II) kinase RfaY n=1 Tax=Fusobacterium sp. MFO224 TaxID=3378070 RepID=UPI003852473C